VFLLYQQLIMFGFYLKMFYRYFNSIFNENDSRKKKLNAVCLKNELYFLELIIIVK